MLIFLHRFDERQDSIEQFPITHALSPCASFASSTSITSMVCQGERSPRRPRARSSVMIERALVMTPSSIALRTSAASSTSGSNSTQLLNGTQRPGSSARVNVSVGERGQGVVAVRGFFCGEEHRERFAKRWQRAGQVVVTHPTRIDVHAPKRAGEGFARSIRIETHGGGDIEKELAEPWRRASFRLGRGRDRGTRAHAGRSRSGLHRSARKNATSR